MTGPHDEEEPVDEVLECSRVRHGFEGRTIEQHDVEGLARRREKAGQPVPGEQLDGLGRRRPPREKEEPPGLDAAQGKGTLARGGEPVGEAGLGGKPQQTLERRSAQPRLHEEDAPFGLLRDGGGQAHDERARPFAGGCADETEAVHEALLAEGLDLRAQDADGLEGGRARREKGCQPGVLNARRDGRHFDERDAGGRGQSG